MERETTKLDALRIDRSATPEKGSSPSRWWILLLLLLAAGTAIWWLKRPAAVVVRTITIQSPSPVAGTSRTLLNASGYVTTRVKATVSSKVTGKVAEILVEEGMKVEKDQVLAKLDDSNVRSGKRLATAQLESAKKALAEIQPLILFTEAEKQRLKPLLETKSVSRSDYDRAVAEAAIQTAKLDRLKADITVAERQVDDWEQQLNDTIIRAPFAGVVTTKDSQPGEMISPMSSGGFTRTGICTLVDMASLEIEVDVGESFINRVKPNQPVEATLDAYADLKLPCKVIAIIPTADRQKATVRVRVAFEQLDPRILPQMGIKVAFQDEALLPTTSARSTLTIPQSAVQERDGRSIAWVVREGKSERRAITVANTNGDKIFVSAGLSSGEVIIINPLPTLTDGTPVTLESPR